MENATDALLMAFAVLIFIIALSVTLTTLAQAKSTADVVLFYSDREQFQTHVKPDLDSYVDGGRDVNIDTVIATLYRCAKENLSVKIINGPNEDDIYIFDKLYNNSIYDDSIKDKIQEFVNLSNKGEIYRETYVEVSTGGVIYEGEDGTQLEEDNEKKIYITYEKK